MEPTDQLEHIGAQVRLLCDIEEIRTLRMLYHELINERRSHEIPALFVDTGSIDFGYMSNSLDGLASSSERNELMKQMIHNHVVEVDGDRASGFAYQEGRGVFHGRAYVYGGRYDDEYVRTTDGWKFLSMRFDPYIFVPFDHSWADPSTRRYQPHTGAPTVVDEGPGTSTRQRD